MKFILLLISSFLWLNTFGQTLIINEVSNGPFGNMEYVEFVVVDNTVPYNCGLTTPPCIDIRGWIFDDNSGYHGTGGVAPGAIRFSFDPMWSCVPLGTIILIYNNGEPNIDLPPDDILLSDGNCNIVAPVNNVNLFESNSTTPGAMACSYPLAGWTPGGNWNNTLLANAGDCARLVDLGGCEVFSLCYGTNNLNNLIYFPGSGANDVWYFNDTDPYNQANWSEGCADNEIILDAGTCGANFQTPGAPNNPLNAAYIGQFNNNCMPITPIVASASTTQNEICGCDGTASASGSGSIPGYTYAWYDASYVSIGQNTNTASSLCAGTYHVIVSSSIDCKDTATIVIAPSTPPVITPTNSGPYCAGATIQLNEVGGEAVSWLWSSNGSALFSDNTAQNPIITNAVNGEIFTVIGTNGSGCSASNTTTVTIYNLPAVTISDPGSICSGTDFIATEVAGDAVSWTWSSDGSAVITNTTDQSPNISGAVNGETIQVVVVDINSCMNSTSIVLNIFPPPSLNPISNSVNCGAYNLPVILGTNLTGSQNYYDDSQLNLGSPISGAITASQTVWVYDGSPGCSDELSFQITINPLPTLTSLSPGGTFCTGDIIGDIIATFSGSPNFTLNYTLDGVSQSVNSASNTINLGNTEGIYVLTSVDDANCSNALSASETISISPLPPAPIVPVYNDMCVNSIQEINSGGSQNINWYSDIALTNLIGTGPVIYVNNAAGTYYYYLTETINGCEGPASELILALVDCSIKVPTAFTPNSNGMNDDWEIIDLDKVYPNNQVFVYNRWGNLLFTSIKGSYDSNRWDGKYKGEVLPVSSYYYIIELNNDLGEGLKGTVSIILE